MRRMAFASLAGSAVLTFGLTACAGVQPGDPCRGPMAPCGGGMVCAQFEAGWGYRCLLGCERRSECPGRAACIDIGSYLVTEARGVCDTWGAREAGETCADEYGTRVEDSCGPGLACSGIAGLRCAPMCDSYSPHSEDRACPEGMICNERISDGVTVTRICLQRCDLSTRSGCEEPSGACIRFLHPDEGEIGVCEDPGSFICDCPVGPCAACPPGQVCVENVCYAPADAPAIPWPIDPDVPPLVD